MELPNRNVIILGAGASFDAGVPLTNQFVEKMWEIAQKKRVGGLFLTDDDLAVFSRALQIRNQIDNFHGRASFDDQNLEDILSILSFEDEYLKDGEKNNVEAIVKAVSRTIELTSIVKPNATLHTIQKEKSDIHILFWENLINAFSNSLSLPTIITFNYDLVLERSLFHLFINPDYKEYPFKYFSLNMHFKKLEDLVYEIQPANYRLRDSDGMPYSVSGSKINLSNQNLNLGLIVDILKLHGSLNFGITEENDSVDISPIKAIKDPFIIPPVANKQLTANLKNIWKLSLERIREARNIIFVGYSMPETDIYFQFFLKTAIGPNTDLNKILIFNPGINEIMKNRYLSCFSDQYKKKVEFNITPHDTQLHYDIGTFQYFTHMIEKYKEILFYM
jgi:hypothetical protein